MTDTPRRRPGRPTVPIEEQRQRLNISLPPDVADKLRASPEGTSATIARLVREHL